MKKKTPAAAVFALMFFTWSAGIAALEGDSAVYYIREIRFDITGRTTEYALLRASEIQAGHEITGKSALLEYISRRRQMLINRRELRQADIDFVLAEPDEVGHVPVDLVIRTVDTRNFIIVPEPKYSSNTGWAPALRVRDFNFLGSMTPLSMDIVYRYHDGGDINYSRNNIKMLLGMEIPFEALGFDWTFNTENIFSYYFGEPFSYGNTSGISVEVPFRNTAFTFGLDQGVYFGDEYDDWRKHIYGVNFEDIWYGASTVYGEWEIPLPVETEFLGRLKYKPALSGSVNYAFRSEDLGDRGGHFFTASKKLGFDKVDWLGNYRRGADLYIENRNEYSFFFGEWSNSVTLNATAHIVLSDFFGISLRGRFTRWLYGAGFDNSARWKAAAMIRGVDDGAIAAKSMLLFNFDFTFHVFNFMFSEYFNDGRLRLIDFELQAAPVIDIALVDGREVDSKRKIVRDITYHPEDWMVSGGFELFFFPLAFRSIYLCASAVWNLAGPFNDGHLPGKDDLELYIGFGHHY
jgi:hypothetical protein